MKIFASVEFAEDASRQSPGRVKGRLLRYGDVTNRGETFAPGSLSWDESGIILNLQHQRTEPLTRFTPMTSGDDLLVDLALPNTQRGRDTALLLREGVYTGLSAEAHILAEHVKDGVTVFEQAQLVGASLVDRPAFPKSVLMEKRGGLFWEPWL